MKFRLQLVTVNDSGQEQVLNMAQLEREGVTMEILGLSLAEGREHKKVGATRSSLGLRLPAVGGKMNSYARPAGGLCVPVQGGSARY